MKNRIQIFEHSILAAGKRGFTHSHFQSLVRLNERHGNRFFAVGLNRIHFRNYVGVIQAGNLTIEILPKADRGAESEDLKKKWQGALIEMLRQSGYIRLSSASDANLRIRSASLLDIYFETFLVEVYALAHQGLVRKYRQTKGNLPALKGRLLFQQNISKNIVHKERFFTAHSYYDRNNPFNQILRIALHILIRLSSNPRLVDLARSLIISFQDLTDIKITQQTFDRLPFSRNTERYKKALQLARLIILNYCPDICGGREDVLAILFDMNSLFERFVYAQLKRAEKKVPARIIFTAQAARPFWFAEGMKKTIRPDILATIGQGLDCEKVVLDTKWKIPSDGKPSDSDLKQMHAYNIQFGAKRSFLIYPKIGIASDVYGSYIQGNLLPPSYAHNCGMAFVDLFDGNKLRKNFGVEIIEMINNN